MGVFVAFFFFFLRLFQIFFLTRSLKAKGSHASHYKSSQMIGNFQYPKLVWRVCFSILDSFFMSLLGSFAGRLTTTIGSIFAVFFIYASIVDQESFLSYRKAEVRRDLWGSS